MRKYALLEQNIGATHPPLMDRIGRVLGRQSFNVMEDTIAFFKVGSFVFSLCSKKELSEDVGSELTTKPYLA
jgi:hypothetical protein